MIERRLTSERPISATRLDWNRIDDWTERLVSDEPETILRVFAKHGSSHPDVLWNPTAEQVPTPPLKFLAARWSGLASGASLPAVASIDALELKPALGYIILLDPIDDGRDFRVRLFGTSISSVSGFDLSGRLLSDHPASGYVVEFMIAATRAALQRRVPLFTGRRPVGAQDTRRWLRLAIPFADDGGRVGRLLVGTVALGNNDRLIG
jgi:hypothetical protein